MEPTDEARLILLAQIALEGVRMTPEAQELASMQRLGTILGAARGRAARGLTQKAYTMSDSGAIVWVT